MYESVRGVPPWSVRLWAMSIIRVDSFEWRAKIAGVNAFLSKCRLSELTSNPNKCLIVNKCGRSVEDVGLW